MAPRAPNHAAERGRFVEDLLDYMTLAEKLGQLVLLAGDDRGIDDRLRLGEIGGIFGPSNRSRAAALQRVAIEETRLGIPLFLADTLGRGKDVVMPSPLALAGSWHEPTIEAVARSLAREAHAEGINWAFGPEVTLSNAARSIEEGTSLGSSLHLAQRIAIAHIRGVEGRAGEEMDVLACPIIDLLQSRERRRDRETADRLALVLAVLSDASPGSVALESSSRAAIDVAGSASDPLASMDRPGGYVGIDLAEWVELARLAGLEQRDPPFSGLSVATLSAAVQAGRIPLDRIDDAVRRVLGAKYDLGMFGSDGVRDRGSSARVQSQPPRTEALEAARRSIILLRNRAGLLPLSFDSGDLLVIGAAATDRQLSMGGAGKGGASLIDGLDELGLRHKFVPGLSLRQAGTANTDRLVDADRMAIGMAGEAARRSGTVIVALGELSSLGEAQTLLLETIRAANENIVLVTLGARPMDPVVGGTHLPCVLHAGQLGTMSGHAIAEILSGEFAPCGRLPAPIIERGRVSLPLGHGLGFTEFGITNAKLELGLDRILVSAELRNLGAREGTESVQLYIRRPGDREGSQAELVGFQRISLVAGEKRRLLFEAGPRDLGRFDREGRFTFAEGRYEFALGLSAARVHPMEIELSRSMIDAMTRSGNGGALPTLFGTLRQTGS